MTIHIEHPDFTYPKCDNFEEGDNFEIAGHRAADCLKCLYFDDVQREWEKYVSQPSNFGEDTESSLLAEHDAFFAGAYAMLAMKIPF